MGLTLYCPAYLGALPWVGSKTAYLSPRLARGEAEAADEAGAEVADDVAEHVLGDEHRVVLRVLEHPHADGVDVRLVGPDARVVLGHLAEDTGHQAAGLAEDVGLLDQRDALAAGLLGVLEGLRQMLVQPCLLTMRVERATFSRPLSFHGFILGLSAQRVVDGLRAAGRTRRRRTCPRCSRGRRPGRS
jgi:hypothetical protein